MKSTLRLLLPLVTACALTSGAIAQQPARDNASHEAEAPVAKPPKNSADDKDAAAREADRAAGKTRTTPQTASADAENPGIGESSGQSNEIARKAAAKKKPAK